MTRAAFLLLTLLLAGCAEPPPKTILTVEVTPEQRAALSPNLRRLLEDIEAGRAAGALASKYAGCLPEAVEVRRVGQAATWYYFALSQKAASATSAPQDPPHQTIGPSALAEGQPVMYIAVYKTGRIIQCGTSKPCF